MHDISASKQPACREAEAVHLEHGVQTPAVLPTGHGVDESATARIVENAMRRRVIRLWIEHEMRRMHAPLLQQVPDRKAIEAASHQVGSTDLRYFQDHPVFLISPTAPNRHAVS